MRETTEDDVVNIVGKIYRDSLVIQTKNYFIEHTYSAKDFESIMDPETFHRIIGFLPNTKYKGIPFIMSVAHNRKTKKYIITVHNPKLKF